MFKRIWAIGDLHGLIHPITDFYLRNKNNFDFSQENDCIILLGDVGANYFFNYRDIVFKEKLLKYPFTYFCIRGNHEQRPSLLAQIDIEEWTTEEFFGNNVYIEKKYPKIKYALDEVAIYNILGENFSYKTLVLPGAYSVDKYYRLANNWGWFEKEQLSTKEMENGRNLIKNNNNFDLVLSHTCPVAYEPTDLFLSVVDQSTVDKTMERYLGEIEYNITYKIWLWGHYHHYRIYPQYQNSQCIMLSDGKEAINIIEWINDCTQIYNTY